MNKEWSDCVKISRVLQCTYTCLTITGSCVLWSLVLFWWV